MPEEMHNAKKLGRKIAEILDGEPTQDGLMALAMMFSAGILSISDDRADALTKMDGLFVIIERMVRLEWNAAHGLDQTEEGNA
jgi:predicted RNA polymerase sigma factor